MSAALWTFAHGDQAWERHENIKAAVASRQPQLALDHLQQFGVYAGIASCLDLARTDLEAFKSFAAQAPWMPGNNWAKFYVQLVKEGCMPVGVGLMTQDFYDAARYMFLKAREATRYPAKLWASAKATAATKLFFPDMVCRHPNWGDRMAKIAEAHVDLKPHEQRQAVLFSLGGYYSFSTADRGTEPAPGATTCFLFARSVLHAAGCNVITDKTPRLYCQTDPSGLGELPNAVQNAVVRAGDLDTGAFPERGDIFIISGGNYISPTTGKLTDSSHVGVITNVFGGKLWEAVEGGAGNHQTLKHTHDLVKVSQGKWVFANDDHVSGKRPISGWISIKKIPRENWMPGAR